MAAPAYSTLVAWEPLRSLGYLAMANTYLPIGTAMVNPIRVVKFYNSTTQDLLISDDGINDKDIIPALSEAIYDFSSNKSDQGGWLVFPKNGVFYTRYIGAPNSGSLYVTTIYGSDGTTAS